MKRLTASLLLACAAAGANAVLEAPEFARAAWYTEISTWLLAIGLIGSTASISLDLLAGRVGTLLAAVSLGVIVKAALVAAVMLALFRTPQSLLLGIAVAQIDPLSVSALNRRGSLSSQGRSFLAAWASFDDPVTVLLTLALSAAVLSWSGSGGGGLPSGLAEGGAAGFGLRLVENLMLVLLLWVLWRVVHATAPGPDRRSPAAARRRLTVTDGLELVVLLLALVAAVRLSLLFGLALSGLFLRPRLFTRRRGELLRDRILDLAYYLAVVLLGFALSHGVDIVAGLALGVTAFLAQAVVAPPLVRRAAQADRLRLALAQQNGITAILLGLTLEPAFPGVLRTIAPAILVVNVLHLGSTALLDRRRLAGTAGRPVAPHSGRRRRPPAAGETREPERAPEGGPMVDARAPVV
jgi:hypothetical protein